MARCIIIRKPACQWGSPLVLGPYAVTFDAQGVAIGPRGERTHPMGAAEVAQAFPDFFEVRPVEGLDDQGILDVLAREARAAGGGERKLTAAMLFAAVSALGPPSAESLRESGLPDDVARDVAAAEAAAAEAGLFPYGPIVRAPVGFESLRGAPVGFTAAAREDEQDPAAVVSSEAGPVDVATRSPAPPSESPAEATPSAPAAPKSYRAAIEEALTRMTTEKAAGNVDTLRSVCAALDIQGVGTSKSEMAAAIRVALDDDPAQQADRERAIANLMGLVQE